MIRSMTGYGKAEVPVGRGRIVVEVRSVNHRYGEVSVKMPRTMLAFETSVRKCVAERLKRGKIEVFIQREERLEGEAVPVVNIDAARSYRDALLEVKRELGLEGGVTLELVAMQRDLFQSADSETPIEELGEELLTAVRGAVDSLEAMRCREGELLLADLRQRRVSLAGLRDMIAQRAPEAVLDAGNRLRERVGQLVGDLGLDDARLAQEIAILADRADITEELVRFESHLRQFDETLASGEPVGRKLDFLLQELNRETNTIGSKTNDARIAATVVELKAELEKIREQIQNIE